MRPEKRLQATAAGAIMTGRGQAQGASHGSGNVKTEGASKTWERAQADRPIGFGKR